MPRNGHGQADMPVKKKAGAKKTTQQPLWSVSPLAAATESLVCDCVGGAIAAINSAGRKLLGRKAKVGTLLSPLLDDATGKPLKSLATLTAGRQPKHLMLISMPTARACLST